MGDGRMKHKQRTVKQMQIVECMQRINAYCETINPSEVDKTSLQIAKDSLAEMVETYIKESEFLTSY